MSRRSRRRTGKVVLVCEDNPQAAEAASSLPVPVNDVNIDADPAAAAAAAAPGDVPAAEAAHPDGGLVGKGFFGSFCPWNLADKNNRFARLISLKDQTRADITDTDKGKSHLFCADLITDQMSKMGQFFCFDLCGGFILFFMFVFRACC